MTIFLCIITFLCGAMIGAIIAPKVIDAAAVSALEGHYRDVVESLRREIMRLGGEL